MLPRNVEGNDVPGAEWITDGVARELMLFAAVGLLIGGVDDLLVDLCFLIRRAWRRRAPRLSLATLQRPAADGRIAVFVPAWDEVAVIGGMLRAALARYRHPDYRVYVGAYPNDRPTIDAIVAVAEHDDRVRLVVNARAGPTTKADCLNALWRALCRDEEREGVAVRAVVLHDAEDVVHPAELAVFDALIGAHDVVQLPVLPLVKSGSPLMSGHYADEFAEHHLKGMVVRTAIGAAMPLAGTGCAIAAPLLARLAVERGGEPFDATSLVEDYELGLRLGELGARATFARVDDGDGGVVAVRAYFPADLDAAVRQKARWMTGIALAGWDRTGWARPLAFGDHWMRMRDRRALLAVLVLAVAYLALLAWGVSLVLHAWAGTPPPVGSTSARVLLATNGALLFWRLAMRVACTGHTYGAREAWWSLPRFLVGNAVMLLAAPRAMVRYAQLLAGATPVWDKTRHEFPDLPIALPFEGVA